MNFVNGWMKNLHEHWEISGNVHQDKPGTFVNIQKSEKASMPDIWYEITYGLIIPILLIVVLVEGIIALAGMV